MTPEFKFPEGYTPTAENLENKRRWDESDRLKENWENFVDGNFSQFNGRIRSLMKKNIGCPCDGFPGEALEKDTLFVTIELGKIIDAPKNDSKKETYRYRTQVGFATAKYIKLCEFWRSNGELYNSNTKELELIDRSELTDFFLESYRNLKKKDVRKFIDLVVDMKAIRLIDKDFWERAKLVQEKCKPENVWNFLETNYLLKYSKDTSRIFLDNKHGDIKDIQDSFTNSFIKVEGSVNAKNVVAFCRGVNQLFWMKKSSFDEYSTLAINISNSIPGDMGFWAIYDAALLEREDIDFTGKQFVGDILNIKKIFGEKTAWVYMMGMTGSVKNKPKETASELQELLSIEINKLNDLSWYHKEKKEIEASDNDPFRKGMLIEYLDQEVEIAKHNRDYYLPQQIEDYPKIDPLLFRSMFKEIINNFGLGEAYLFANFWKEGFYCHYYSDGSKSDFKTVLEFPELLKNFKNSVSEKVYKRAMYTTSKMANLGTRMSMKLINDVMECYANKGEKITLGRINYTYGLYYLREGYRMGCLGGIDGLEKTERDIYKRRKKQKK